MLFSDAKHFKTIKHTFTSLFFQQWQQTWILLVQKLNKYIKNFKIPLPMYGTMPRNQMVDMFTWKNTAHYQCFWLTKNSVRFVVNPEKCRRWNSYFKKQPKKMELKHLGYDPTIILLTHCVLNFSHGSQSIWVGSWYWYPNSKMPRQCQRADTGSCQRHLGRAFPPFPQVILETRLWVSSSLCHRGQDLAVEAIAAPPISRASSALPEMVHHQKRWDSPLAISTSSLGGGFHCWASTSSKGLLPALEMPYSIFVTPEPAVHSYCLRC